MVEATTDASVVLWGREVAAVSWIPNEGIAVFQYDPDFAESGIQLSPLAMPLRPEPYSFPVLPKHTFKGLPGLLADSLPDRYGDRLINAWLAKQSRAPESFNPVERLCYVGERGMGALEFKPMIGRHARKPRAVEVAELVRLANLALDEKSRLEGVLGGNGDQAAIDDILRVGTSAGGARAKAIPEGVLFAGAMNAAAHPRAGRGQRRFLLGIRTPASFGMVKSTQAPASRIG